MEKAESGHPDSVRFIMDYTAIDLEIVPPDRIFRAGAIRSRDGESMDMALKNPARDIDRLSFFSSESSYVLGHNLIFHDLPALKALRPDLPIFDKKIIDTLFLSPLAFPENPYHRLVKDYKLVRSSVSDPVEDCRIAMSVFMDQIAAFRTLKDSDPEILRFYEFSFRNSVFSGLSGNGIADVFRITGELDGNSYDPATAYGIFSKKTKGLVCENHLHDFLPEILGDPSKRPVAAYCLAWLLVSGSNSVIPPWVIHRFPLITTLLKRIRATNCGDDKCLYCLENHDPELHLKRFFGFDKFRSTPATSDGKSLQKEIVSTGLSDQPLLGILPTGGGKSICYQLPALVRHWRQGQLTIVISPLRALMKDQVDNLVKNTGTPFAEAVYGGMLQPEKGAILERVRLGDTAILYVSPEQLRNRSLKNAIIQREIGCWVFDEAHCFSKWGHDFRPDYLYASRFIMELAMDQNMPVPPVCCYTATAKKEVKEEVCKHFQDELSLSLMLLEGELERSNLHFGVESVSLPKKKEEVLRLIKAQQLEDPVSPVIVYAAERETTEELAEYLVINGIEARAFHGGMEPMVKDEIIEAFSSGSLQVICATNAFGMGIDKDNIRLVIHHDMPGSLENYIQEAGRAGRDTNPARCILLYDSQNDSSQQFRLSAFSELRKSEIVRILRAIRKSKRNSSGEIVISVEELLRDDELISLKEEKESGQSKVKTAVSWLERSGFLKRNENRNDVFQGRPKIINLEEARKKIAESGISRANSELWLGIIGYFFNTDRDRVSVSEIAENVLINRFTGSGVKKSSNGYNTVNEVPFGEVNEDRADLRTFDDDELKPDRIVINALHEMADAGLIEKGLVLSAFVRPKGKNNSLNVLSEVAKLEEALIELMKEMEPDAESGDMVVFNARSMNHKLVSNGFASNPKKLSDFLKSLSQDGKGLAASHGSIVLVHAGVDKYHIRFLRSWDSITAISEIRKNTARAIIEFLCEKAMREAAKSSSASSSSGQASQSDYLVSFTTNDLADAINSDIGLRSIIRKPLAAIDNALRYMHDHRIITLQNGMGIFKQSMTLRLEPSAKGRRYTKGDFKPLLIHYEEKRFQVHVMMEYSRLAIEKIASALRLVFDYFSMDRISFINKYFEDQKEIINKATSREMFRSIVEKLENPVQIASVSKENDRNLLILAGPGSGKTTVIVHRCAYLLLVERVPARNILVVCFNHNSALSLRKRLFALAGDEARFVNISTYHGLAMRLAGISAKDMAFSGRREDMDFDSVLDTAIKLLNGETDIPGFDRDEIKERVLAGFTHILVDEYQDIDEKQYDLVSSIAGKTVEDKDSKLTIMAVGDDDQNIYAFRGANIDFIRRFEKDYNAEYVYLVENYRSTAAIIEAANTLISVNSDRMKTSHPVKINSSRKAMPKGGRWSGIDGITKGRVQIIETSDIYSQAISVSAEIKRIMALAPDSKWSDFALISRTRLPFDPIKSVFEIEGIPFVTVMDGGIPYMRIREINRFQKSLEEKGKTIIRPSMLCSDSFGHVNCNQNPWTRLIGGFISDLEAATSDAECYASSVSDELFEFIAEQRRERVIGDGVFLNTIHSAKGLEFRYVFILGSGWPEIKSRKQAEEERRIMYVGMTRAMELLTVMNCASDPNPFIRDFASSGSVFRRSMAKDAPSDKVRFRKYGMLGLNDIFLSYPGLFSEDHRIHRHLSMLETGDELFPSMGEGGRIELKESSGVTVAKLSVSASAVWGKRLGHIDQIDRIERIRIIAMIKRYADDSQSECNLPVKTDSWEVPVCEVVYNGNN